MLCHMFGTKLLPEPIMTYCEMYNNKIKRNLYRNTKIVVKKINLKNVNVKWQIFCLVLSVMLYDVTRD